VPFAAVTPKVEMEKSTLHHHQTRYRTRANGVGVSMWCRRPWRERVPSRYPGVSSGRRGYREATHVVLCDRPRHQPCGLDILNEGA
jgi:hypothetical protein